MITEYLNEKLMSQVLVKDPPKLEMNFEEIFERNEFMRLLRENITKKDEGKEND